MSGWFVKTPNGVRLLTPGTIEDHKGNDMFTGRKSASIPLQTYVDVLSTEKANSTFAKIDDLAETKKTISSISESVSSLSDEKQDKNHAESSFNILSDKHSDLADSHASLQERVSSLESNAEPAPQALQTANINALSVEEAHETFAKSEDLSVAQADIKELQALVQSKQNKDDNEASFGAIYGEQSKLSDRVRALESVPQITTVQAQQVSAPVDFPALQQRLAAMDKVFSSLSEELESKTNHLKFSNYVLLGLTIICIISRFIH